MNVYRLFLDCETFKEMQKNPIDICRFFVQLSVIICLTFTMSSTPDANVLVGGDTEDSWMCTVCVWRVSR